MSPLLPRHGFKHLSCFSKLSFKSTSAGLFSRVSLHVEKKKKVILAGAGELELQQQ